MIIAIDGFSSCGKSTFAKAIAKKMNMLYVDSGAMYRAITWACIEKNCLHQDDEIIKLLDDIHIDFKINKETGQAETYLNNKNIEKQIRGMLVSENVSHISKIAEVRQKLVALQREMAQNKSVVMDGRDIGTTVFPHADLKIFMTASAEIRAERRYKELIEKGIKRPFEEVKKNIEERDYIDQNREISPLKKADDAIILDNSKLAPDEQMQWFDVLIKKQ